MRNIIKVFGVLISISLFCSCGSVSMQSNITYNFKNTKLTIAVPSNWTVEPQKDGKESWLPLNSIAIYNKKNAKDSQGNLDLNDKDVLVMFIYEEERNLDADQKFDEKTAKKYNNVYVLLGEPFLNESDKIEDKSNLNSFRGGVIYISKSRAYPFMLLYRDHGNLPSEFEQILNTIVIEEN